MDAPKGPKGKRPKKPHGLQIPETVQHEVVVRRMQGKSKTAIGKSLGMARKTINRILGQGEYSQMVQMGRSRIALLIPKAVEVVGHHLNRKTTDKAVDVAIEILKGVQVLVPRSRADLAPAMPDEFEGWTDEQLLHFAETGERPGGTEEF